MEVSKIKPTKYQILEIFKKKNIQKVIELEKSKCIQFKTNSQHIIF
jgi:hypothetical protein